MLILGLKGLSLTSLVTITAGAYPGFCSMKQLGVLLLLLDGMLVHRR